MALPQLAPSLEDVLQTPTFDVVRPDDSPPEKPRQLAILGGTPAFESPLHVGRPNIGERAQLQARIDAMLDARWLSNDGPLVRDFERRVADFLGVKHCVSTCNGTTALMLAMRGLDLQGEVIVPSFTFVATAHALQWQQTTPVFCDVDPRTHNLDPKVVEQHISSRTTGIVGVHLWGRPCDTEALEEIAARHRLKLLFDASHAFGCSRGGKMLGSFGDAEVFSFHATKFINTFEGGAVVTNSDDLAKKLRFMRNFGFADYDTVQFLGMNAKMAEVCAAMGLTGLESIEQFIAVNRRNHTAYHTQLSGIPGLAVAAYDYAEKNNFQYVIVEVDPALCPLTRDELVRVLHAENILARRYFFPGCHRMEPYRSMYPMAGLALPETHRLSDRVLALPTGTAINHQDIETVAAVIHAALCEAGHVKRVLAVA